MTFDDLEAGFIIWIVTVVVAILVYICEKLYFNFTNKQKKSPKLNKNVEPKNKKKRQKTYKAHTQVVKAQKKSKISRQN